MRIADKSGYYKLEPSKKRAVDKAVKKLSSLIQKMPGFQTCKNGNNPAIHDSYGPFYVYKHTTKEYSVRLLYKYANDLEIHMIHFKQGERDNSKYIEVFERYAWSYERGVKCVAGAQ